MDRYSSYHGRRSTARRRRSSASVYTRPDKSSRRAAKLFICAGLFVVAAITKLFFPSAFTAVGDKINSVVNYKAALTTIGEGISGEKDFVAALGEAFTYAFTGASDMNPAVETDQTSDDGDKVTQTIPAASDSVAVNDPATEKTGTPPQDDAAAVFAQDPETSAETDTGESDAQSSDLSDAIISAFIQSQDEYSDYSIPAGVTYGMPRISVPHEMPVDGAVSSPFGYRVHPIDKTVKFHYGTDIAASKGAAIKAFADGKVIATGESTTLGKYVIITHGDLETKYAHCGLVVASSGQQVKLGDRIATVGETGNATSACLHFELKINGVYVNPEYYF